MRILLHLLFCLSAIIAFAQSDQSGFLITGVEVHTGKGDVIENGAVGVKSGIITYAGKLEDAPKTGYAITIEHNGAMLYPGLIAGNTTLGLNEIFAVRATHDYREVGVMKPNVRALIAYNAESVITETVLANGILFAQICPRGGVIKGKSSVVKLQGWNWEDAAYKVDEGIHMDWPQMFKRKGDRDDPRAYEPDDEYIENLRKIKSYFADSRAYAKRENPITRDIEKEAMRGVFSGETRLYISADFIKEIREIVAFKRTHKIDKITIVGGYDAWMAAELLRENNISVMVKRTNSLPKFAEDPIDAAFSLPGKLAEEGVLFCFQMDGDMETMQNRNLPFNIGSAIAYGLDREKALQAATLDAAKILGIDERTGSIELGKEANFIITEGDLFDMRTSIIKQAYIKGEKIDLGTRQKELYEKYMGKYGLETN
ncbi:MAG TPA: amidohydrolase family protein [Cryomorphaceae bacterium]|nr:amidohydrolase family protein [Cryomorphaceae bacterium]